MHFSSRGNSIGFAPTNLKLRLVFQNSLILKDFLKGLKSSFHNYFNAGSFAFAPKFGIMRDGKNCERVLGD